MDSLLLYSLISGKKGREKGGKEGENSILFHPFLFLAGGREGEEEKKNLRRGAHPFGSSPLLQAEKKKGRKRKKKLGLVKREKKQEGERQKGTSAVHPPLLFLILRERRGKKKEKRGDTDLFIPPSPL